MKCIPIALAASAFACGFALSTPPILSLTQVALQAVDPEIKPDHYDIASADLDGDGKEDVLALMNAKSGYCGSGGCTMFVLKGNADGFSNLCSVKVVNPPIYLRKTSTNGMRDLLVTVRGGGATPGLAALTFSGTGYPAAPGDATAKVEDGDTVLFAEPPKPFEKSDSLHGITFKVTSPNSASSNTITLTPTGLGEDNRPITEETGAIVTGAEVADINADGSPEIYIYTKNASKHAGLVAYSANKKKSLSQIFLPELGEHAKGYRGGDEFAVVEGIIARRFPVYPEDTSKNEPTGKIRQLQYKLSTGEAGWLLKVNKVIEF
jgi:hypothetical protein